MKSPSRWGSPITSRPSSRATSARFLGSRLARAPTVLAQPRRLKTGNAPLLVAVAQGNRGLERHYRCELAVGVDDFKPARKVQDLAGAHPLRCHLASGLDGFLLGGSQIGKAFALLVLGAPASLVNVNKVDGHAADNRTSST